MDLARECSSWSGKLHFRLIILVQGKASFHLIFISDYSFWNKLWMCSTVTSSIRFFFLNAKSFWIGLHVKNMAKFTFLNQVTKTNLSQSCCFFFFLIAGLFMVIINSCWLLSGYTNAPAARNKGFRYPISKCLIQLLSVHLLSTHLQPVWRISFSTIFTIKMGKNWGMTCNVRRTTCLIHSYL